MLQAFLKASVGLTGRLEGRPCMLSSGPLLLDTMGWLEGGADDWELKES